MATAQEFELVFDRDIWTELDDRQIDIGREIQQVNPELGVRQGRSMSEGVEQQRDVVTIITAIAALAPLVVPIVIELIKRKLPHVESEIVIEEGLEGRKVIKIVRKET
jgi:hypothetical protein